MATRATFSDGEWETLQWAVSDTMAYLTLSDPGFFDTFKEAGAAARFMAGAKGSTQSGLVRELAGDPKMGRDKSVTADPADMKGAVTARVRQAAAIVAAKAPEDLEAFRAFIRGVAQATAEAAKGVNPNEAEAMAAIEAALTEA